MLAKDYPSFLERAKKNLEQEYLEYELSNAKFEQVVMKEGPIGANWRRSPLAQSHSWDFYLDEIDWA